MGCYAHVLLNARKFWLWSLDPVFIAHIERYYKHLSNPAVSVARKPGDGSAEPDRIQRARKAVILRLAELTFLDESITGLQIIETNPLSQGIRKIVFQRCGKTWLIWIALRPSHKLPFQSGSCTDTMEIANGAEVPTMLTQTSRPYGSLTTELKMN